MAVAVAVGQLSTDCVAARVVYVGGRGGGRHGNRALTPDVQAFHRVVTAT